MDIEKLIDRLGENTDCWTDKVHGYADLRLEAATALSTLKGENEKMREKIEDARLEGYAKGLGEMSEENEKLRAELEQVKAERDAAVERLREWEKFDIYLLAHNFLIPEKWRGIQKED